MNNGGINAVRGGAALNSSVASRIAEAGAGDTSLRAAHLQSAPHARTDREGGVS
jgi:hypothetical protein